MLSEGVAPQIHRMVAGVCAAGEKALPRKSPALKRRADDSVARTSKRQRTMDVFLSKDVPKQ